MTRRVWGYGSLLSRLCENSDVELARRISVSISSLWKTDCTGNFCWEKAIEKTILRVLGSSGFSHSLGQTEKNSVRANVFRYTLKLGHRLMQSARLVKQ